MSQSKPQSPKENQKEKDQPQPTSNQPLIEATAEEPTEPVVTEEAAEVEEEVADEATAPLQQLLITQEEPDAERIFKALSVIAELLTSAPDIDLDVLGDEDLSLSYHVIVTTKKEKVEYRNSVKLPMALSLENEVDALDMIESQLDLTTRPAKNFCMRLLREVKEGSQFRISGRE